MTERCGALLTMIPVLVLLLGCHPDRSYTWRSHRPLGSHPRVTAISPTQTLSLAPGEHRDLELECGIEGGLGPGLEAVWARLGGTRASILGEAEEVLAVWGEDGEVYEYEEGVEAIIVREEAHTTWRLVIQRVDLTHAGLYQCQVRRR